MALIELTKSHYGSLSQSIPEVKLHNMYVSENPLSPTGYSYITRPVVADFLDFGSATIRGIFYQQGFANDLLMVVAGGILYSVTATGIRSVIGNINGTDICQFASTIYGIGIVSDGFLSIYDGTSIIDVAIPDNMTPATITSLNNYFIIAMKDSNKFFWIEPGDTTIDDLAFASAESNPDYIVAIQAISDELWIIGRESTEVWAVSADPDAPFNRIAGRVFNKGCISEHSVAAGVYNSLPCLIWVSDKKEVLLSQGSPNKISNDFVEEMLRRSTYYRGWFFQRQRNDFYVLSTDVITLVYDVGNNVWYKWSTDQQTTWKISAGAQQGTTLFGVNLLKSPMLYRLSEGYVDGDKEWLVCEVTGFVPYNKRDALPCISVELLPNTGLSSSYLTEPIVEMRWSDDQGANWSSYMQASLGVRGNTNNRVEFRSIGLIKTPGRRFEFRFSLAEQFRLDYAIINKEA